MWSGKEVVDFLNNKSSTYRHTDMSVLVQAIDGVDRNEWKTTFPKIVDLAENVEPDFLKNLAGQELVQLRRGEIACVLAKCFIGTFPPEQKINFEPLFNSSSCQSEDTRRLRVEKIKTLLAFYTVYFKCVEGGKIKDQKVSYRLVKGEGQVWHSGERKLLPLRIAIDVNIYYYNSAQVNFANKVIGGGVLGNGCVQEEIRFITCPELLLARFLFPQELKDDEAILIYNFRRYAYHVGYGKTFLFDGENDKFLEEKQRMMLSMDALNFSRMPSAKQYEKSSVDRELLKAFTAFKASPTQEIATGNWGGGVFKGDAEVKAVIQMIAAAQAGRCLLYCIQGDKKDQDSLERKIKRVNKNFQGLSVGAAYTKLLSLCSEKSSA